MHGVLTSVGRKWSVGSKKVAVFFLFKRVLDLILIECGCANFLFEASLAMSHGCCCLGAQCVMPSRNFSSPLLLVCFRCCSVRLSCGVTHVTDGGLG